MLPFHRKFKMFFTLANNKHVRDDDIPYHENRFWIVFPVRFEVFKLFKESPVNFMKWNFSLDFKHWTDIIRCQFLPRAQDQFSAKIIKVFLSGKRKTARHRVSAVISEPLIPHLSKGCDHIKSGNTSSRTNDLSVEMRGDNRWFMILLHNTRCGDSHHARGPIISQNDDDGFLC